MLNTAVLYLQVRRSRIGCGELTLYYTVLVNSHLRLQVPVPAQALLGHPSPSLFQAISPQAKLELYQLRANLSCTVNWLKSNLQAVPAPVQLRLYQLQSNLGCTSSSSSSIKAVTAPVLYGFLQAQFIIRLYQLKLYSGCTSSRFIQAVLSLYKLKLY